MERPYPVVEFETVIAPGGIIALPAAIAKLLSGGRQVTVRITDGVVSRSLRDRGITEDLVERVAELQMEQRGNVVGFFRAEGSLASAAKFKLHSGTKRRSR